ncbi:hypothetical protein HT585_20715 [Ensifer sp. HO-A22]|uniref:Uncharacterized protein n=1 Tax=Ensifer oleiphilus TaxID=2742698 RepID=A0A7Y6Q915_9HYPH|nr:hypothetical protein [Ensifer oleiphilus]NVD41302.1 hypothetical protein [Ensifer oleiphilus]
MTKVLRGRKGHLFLDNDTNNVQLQTAGIPFMTHERFESIASSHKSADERAKARAGRYIHLIAPNKETGCRDYLPSPEIYEMHGKTPANLFMANTQWSASTYFNHNILCDHTCQYRHYDVDESHWSVTGALIYLEEAFCYFGWDEELEALKSIDRRIAVAPSQGDLASLVNLPPRRLPRVEVRNRQSVLHFHGDVANEGFIQHFTCCRGSGRALILHDSFLMEPLPFLTEIFSETLAVHCPDFLLDLEEQYRPDVVIKLQAERFFPYIPVERPSTDEWLCDVEKRKQADCSNSRAYITSIADPALRVAAE